MNQHAYTLIRAENKQGQLHLIVVDQHGKTGTFNSSDAGLVEIEYFAQEQVPQ